MTSIARIAANRANARKSTGPKTAAGKARVSHNARRHGLSRPLSCEGARRPQIELLARQLAGEDACGERLTLACNIAAAQFDLARIRIAKRDLQDAANFGTTDDKHPCDWSVLPQLERLDRYEQRVFTRRRRAIFEFCKSKPMPAAEDTSNNNCKDSVGASVRSSGFTRPLSACGKEGRPRRSRREGGTTNKAGRFTYCSKCPESSASVPGENVTDNSCRTNPTDHKGVNPATPQEVTVERFCKTKPFDATAALPLCAAPTLSSRAKSSKAKSSKAKQFLQNKANGQRSKEYKTATDCMRAARFDASQPNRAWVISQSGPTFIRGP